MELQQFTTENAQLNRSILSASESLDCTEATYQLLTALFRLADRLPSTAKMGFLYRLKRELSSELQRQVNAKTEVNNV